MKTIALATLISLAFNGIQNTPTLFEPGKISTGKYERDMALSPDGKELYYTIQHPKTGYSQIVCCTKTKTGWSIPQIASFSGKYSDLEPAFSPDGKRLYFASDRPLDQQGNKKDYDIWYTQRIKGQWSTPVNLGHAVNAEGNEFYPSVTRNGNLYFTAERKGGVGREDIYVSAFKNNNHIPAVALDTNINSYLYEFNAFVDPDEKYIVFTSYGRPDDFGKGDLYISKKNNKGEWTPAINMGKEVNSAWLDYCPFVSPDGKTLYFTSERVNAAGLYEKQKTFFDFELFLNDAGNGNGDIYTIPFKW